MTDSYKYPSEKGHTTIGILLWAVIYSVIACVFLYHFNILDFGSAKTRDALFFVIYASAYWGIWTAYLRSGDKPSRLKFWTLPRVHSLRLLLRSESKTYAGSSINFQGLQKPEKSADENEPYSYWKEKAKSSITATTVLATMSFLALLQFLPETNTNCAWQKPTCEILVNSGRLFSVMAIIAFMITVDSFDLMLNDFGWRKNDDSTHRIEYLMTHFYDRARLPRYVGVSAVIFCGVLLIALRDFWLACAAIGIVFVMGWNYWFPKLPDTSQAPRVPIFLFWIVTILPLCMKVYS